jgi:Xaa-Pro aminopeptidase
MSVHAQRRARLMAQMEPGCIALIATAPAVMRNRDCAYPYRHDSYFYYLSGSMEPESVIVLVAAKAASATSAASTASSMLFCRAKDAARELWEGQRLGPQGAGVHFGFDQAWPVDILDAQMVTLLTSATALYYPMASISGLDAQVQQWQSDAAARASASTSAKRTVPAARDLRPMLDEMRLLKDDAEQQLMRRAATISGAAHCRAMAATRPNMREYQIEAELLYEFRKNGAQAPAYASIVAAGANACVLHYSANDGVARAGDLVLIDAGCELNGYASDISRTYPVNGRFSTPQKMLYELVLAAQHAALQAAQPGQPYAAMHSAAVRVLAQGMLDFGLLNKNTAGSVDDVIADQSYRRFYMHGTGHWLGMDVHDVGQYRTGIGTQSATAAAASRPLQPGMMLTVEPGIYVRAGADVPQQFWDIGIRIEDDVLITPQGHAIISNEAPKTVSAIEQMMQHARAL